MRPLLRWISLGAAVAVLGALGAARAHQHNFPLFLGVLLAMSAVIVVVFVATAPGDRPD